MKMEKQKVATALALVLVSALCAGASAQSSCTSVLISLSPCLNYITGNSSSTPSSQCCTQLATVVRTQAQCLCAALSADASSLGINVNRTQALQLPRACNVQTPPISSCNAGSPADSPKSPESGGTVPSGPGSELPSSPENGAAGTSTKLSISLLAILLLATSYSSISAIY